MNWKNIAKKYLPENEYLIDTCDSPYEFWLDRFDEFRCFYNDFSRLDEFKRLFELALYCVHTTENVPAEMSGATWVSFFEDIPLTSCIWDKLPSVLAYDEFTFLSDNGLFNFHRSAKKMIESYY